MQTQHFKFVVAMDYQGELQHLVHVKTRRDGEFLGKRWLKQGPNRSWELLKANYRTNTAGVVKTSFVFKGLQKRVLWLEPHVVQVVAEWFEQKLRPKNLHLWTVKYKLRDDLPF